MSAKKQLVNTARKSLRKYFHDKRERQKIFAYKLILERFTEALQPKRMLEGTDCKQCYKSDFETVAVSFTSGSYYDSEVPAKPYMLALSIYRGPAKYGQYSEPHHLMIHSFSAYYVSYLQVQYVP